MVRLSTITAALLLFAAGSAFAGGGGKLTWEKDVDAGLAKAKKSGMPAALYFTADW
jgi:hypothetical protein